MNIENSIIGTIFGGVGGLVTAALMALGLKNRIDKLDVELEKKQNISFCIEFHKLTNTNELLRFDFIDQKLIKLGKDQELTFDKIDKLDHYIRNGK